MSSASRSRSLACSNAVASVASSPVSELRTRIAVAASGSDNDASLTSLQHPLRQINDHRVLWTEFQKSFDQRHNGRTAVPIALIQDRPQIRIADDLRFTRIAKVNRSFGDFPLRLARDDRLCAVRLDVDYANPVLA